MKNLLSYQRAIVGLYRARDAGNEPLEEQILSQMDHIWASMSPQERTGADSLSARIASGELSPFSLEEKAQVNEKKANTIRVGSFVTSNVIDAVRAAQHAHLYVSAPAKQGKSSGIVALVVQPKSGGFGSFVAPIVRAFKPKRDPFFNVSSGSVTEAVYLRKVM